MTIHAPDPATKAATLMVGPAAFVADAAGALWHEDDRILIVSDLHLEKGSAFARRGSLLPPFDSRETLARLAGLVARYEPRALVSLGDTLHDRDAMGRIAQEDAAALDAALSGVERIWITGNHDPEIPPGLGGAVVAEIAIGEVVFRHEPSASADGLEVAGHLHPAAKVRMRGRAVRKRCFVSDGRRCVMPAFGAYAGGLNVLDAAFRPLFAGSFTARLLGGERVYAVDRRMLVAD